MYIQYILFVTVLITGLGNERRCLKDGGCQFWLSYYQWTAWVLLLLAFGFYLPRSRSKVNIDICQVKLLCMNLRGKCRKKSVEY